MATKKRPCAETAGRREPGLPPVYYQLHALLQSIRALQCHEDEICALLHQIQRTGRLTSGVQREIALLLRALPTTSLEAELQAVYAAVDEAAA